ncbi:hypothetical protein BC628DRAFT_1435010 [Trametes gibbosa]|nr:hypothetical protein BC628DRAFT_1435010 [Trametes gibbosa]
MSGSDAPATSGRHNDFVGGDASKGRIVGAEKATTGHHFVSVDPFGPGGKGQRRAQEHLPSTTVRDAPPSGGVAPGTCPTEPVRSKFASRREARVFSLKLVSEQTSTSPPRRMPTSVQPLAPAPDSRTVVDNDPYATPTSAGDTLTGATSQDVHGGLGHPGAGMSSAEQHHDGSAHRKRQLRGTDTFGSGEIPRGAGEAE